MKTSIALVTVLMTLTTAAQASWYQGYCSNAEGTIRTASGHNRNFIQLTKRVWGNGGMQETIILDNEGKIRDQQIDEQVLSHEQKNVCHPGQKWGMFSSEKVAYTKVRIANDDGSLFDKDIVGVSKDLKTVDATLLCQFSMNSESMCQE